MNNMYKIIAAGRGYNPSNWFYNPTYLISRIYYICGGTAYYRKNLQLKPGFLYIFRPNPEFEVSQDPNDPIDHVFFDFTSVQPLINKEYIELDLSEHPVLQHIMLAASDNFKIRPVAQSLPYSYFDILMYNLAPYCIADNNLSYITCAALKYIHVSDIENLSVSSIADAINTHINHVIRCFKNDLGVTPHKYISMLKADMAINYLKQQLGTAEIAQRLGFESVSALSTFFKKQTGKCLSDFR